MEEDDSPTKALGDPTIRPSERQAKHDELLEDRRKKLEGLAVRMTDTQSKAEDARMKIKAVATVLGCADDNGDLQADVEDNGDMQGWASYLDDESGRYYWFNEQTGEAYYDAEVAEG